MCGVRDGRDVAQHYIETPLGAEPKNAMAHYSKGSHAYNALPALSACDSDPLRYLVKVYVDDFMGMAIPTSCCVLNHVANGVMCGIHDVFPPTLGKEDNLISLNKIMEGRWVVCRLVTCDGFLLCWGLPDRGEQLSADFRLLGAGTGHQAA